MFDETAVHIIGGGIGGTLGAIVTCPLEVVKVRLQSSQGIVLRSPTLISSSKSDDIRGHESNFRHVFSRLQSKHNKHCQPMNVENSCSYNNNNNNSNLILTKRNDSTNINHKSNASSNSFDPVSRPRTGFRFSFKRSLILCSIIDIFRHEGAGALFKGLIPTLIGVLPSRGIYFCAYHKGQLFFEKYFTSGSSAVYLCAAGVGSITASSLTNPIWFVKTRLQLDSRPGRNPITVSQVIQSTWKKDGLRGFYRGVSASYFGSVETALNFVIYEKFKSELLWLEHKRKEQSLVNTTILSSQPHRDLSHQTNKSAMGVDHCNCSPQKPSDLRGSSGGSKLTASRDMALCMIASAFSKIIAITATYPHEVVRTRLREEHDRYRGFFRTIRLIYNEERFTGLYRGMGTHYVRQVPNSCIMIGTYEFVVYLLQSWSLTRESKTT